MQLFLSGGNKVTVDPAKADAGLAIRGAGHHPSLILGNERNLLPAGLVGEDERIGELLEECKVISKRGCRAFAKGKNDHAHKNKCQ